MDLLKRMLRGIKQRLLYQFLLLTGWVLVFLIIDIVLGHVALEWKKSVVSIFCGIGVAVMSRPRISEMHKVKDEFYIYRFADLSTYSRIIGWAVIAAGFVSILFVKTAYLYLAGVCGGCLYILFILQFEKDHGRLLWGRPQPQ
jgi:hypothetical protein